MSDIARRRPLNHCFLTRVLMLIVGGILMTELESAGVAAEYDRPAQFSQQSRSVVVAKNGIVATSHPLAAQTGLDVRLIWSANMHAGRRNQSRSCKPNRP